MMALRSNEGNDSGGSIGESDESSDGNNPPPKRFRLDEGSENLGSNSPHDFTHDASLGSDSPPSVITTKVIQVSRKERAGLLKKFRQEQKMERRRHKLKVRATWETEIADGKENQTKQGDATEEMSNVQTPIEHLVLA